LNEYPAFGTTKPHIETTAKETNEHKSCHQHLKSLTMLAQIGIMKKILAAFRNQKRRSPLPNGFGERAGLKKVFGGVLLSHTASRAVPSALKSLTSVFGMGTGVASSPSPPKNRYRH
jgi:hypothetical protein